MAYEVAAGILMATGVIALLSCIVFFAVRMVRSETEMAQRAAWTFSVVLSCLFLGVLGGIFAP